MVHQSQRYHQIVADYFTSKTLYLDEPIQNKPNTRKLVEQPWQQTKAEMWDQVTETICNLNFIQCKASAKLTIHLFEDIGDVLKAIPDYQENIRIEKLRQNRLNKYTKDLLASSNGELEKIDIPECITPWSKSMIEDEINRMKTHPTRSDKLLDFRNFLGQEAVTLNNFATEFHHLAYQRAWNYADSGPVGKSVEDIDLPDAVSLLLCPKEFRPKWNPSPHLIMLLDGHYEHIQSISTTPNGEIGISGSSDHSCILWNLTNGEKILTLVGHSDTVSSVKITPDGKRAISGSIDKTCVVWDLTVGKIIYILEGYSGYVTDVSITPDGTKAITTYSSIKMYEGLIEQRGKVVMAYEKTAQPKLVSESKKRSPKITFPDIYKKNVFIDQNENFCILWDLKIGKPLKVLSSDMEIEAVSIAANGENAVMLTGNNAVLWNLKNGGILGTIDVNDYSLSNSKPHINILPNGKRAVLSYSGSLNCITFWDFNSGKTNTITLNSSAISTVTTPNGEVAVTASRDASYTLWDLKKGVQIVTAKLNFFVTGGFMMGVDNFYHPIDVTADGKRIITAMSGTKIGILEFEKGINELDTCNSDRKQLTSLLSISIDGQKAITGSKSIQDNKYFLWNLKNLKLLKIIEGPTSKNGMEQILFVKKAAKITPDGKRAIASCINGDCKIWDLQSGEVSLVMNKHFEPIDSIEISGDGTKVITVSKDMTILWNLITLTSQSIVKEHSGVNTMQISPDGHFALLAYENGDLMIWDLIYDNSRAIFKFDNSSIQSLSISPDGRLVLLGTQGGTCILFNIKDRTIKFNLKGHKNAVIKVLFSPDSLKAISSSHDKTCIVWDLKEGKQISKFYSGSIVFTTKDFTRHIKLTENVSELMIFDKPDISEGSKNGIVSAIQIWDSDITNYTDVLVDCPFCNNRFKPTETIISTIDLITKKADLDLSQSPCLDLPEELWNDPGLINKCPNCKKGLKYNPFIIKDQREIKKSEKNFKYAIKVYQELSESYPLSSSYQDKLVSSQVDLAYHYTLNGNWKGAIIYYENVIILLENLIKKYPNEGKYLNIIILCYTALPAIYRKRFRIFKTFKITSNITKYLTIMKEKNFARDEWMLKHITINRLWEYL